MVYDEFIEYLLELRRLILSSVIVLQFGFVLHPLDCKLLLAKEPD